MNRSPALLLFFLSSLVAVFTLSCGTKEPKPEATLEGTYTGSATNNTNSADKKTLSVTITSSGPPLAGTYVLNGASGKITGSVLGLILTMTLKPDAGGTTYTLSGTADDNDTSLSGTMTGIESAKTVTYTVLVKK